MQCVVVEGGSEHDRLLITRTALRPGEAVADGAMLRVPSLTEVQVIETVNRGGFLSVIDVEEIAIVD